MRGGFGGTFGLGGAVPHVVQAVRDPVSAMHGALGRVLALRSVLQPVALPAVEIAPAIDVAAAPTAFDAHEPLASAAELGGGMHERDKLVDADLLATIGRKGIPETQTVGLHEDVDRAGFLPAPRPRQSRAKPWLQQASLAEPCEIDAVEALAGGSGHKTAPVSARSGARLQPTTDAEIVSVPQGTPTKL